MREPLPMTSLPPQLVIFDCDGVLVDSELITNRVFAQMLNELGLPVTLDDMFEQFVGNSMSHCLGLITGMLGKPLPSTFVDEYQVRTRKSLEANCAQLQALRRHLMLSICLTAWRRVAIIKRCVQLSESPGSGRDSKDACSASPKFLVGNLSRTCSYWLPSALVLLLPLALLSKTLQ